jgi:hypothetical protein
MASEETPKQTMILVTRMTVSAIRTLMIGIGQVRSQFGGVVETYLMENNGAKYGGPAWK